MLAPLSNPGRHPPPLSIPTTPTEIWYPGLFPGNKLAFPNQTGASPVQLASQDPSAMGAFLEGLPYSSGTGTPPVPLDHGWLSGGLGEPCWLLVSWDCERVPFPRELGPCRGSAAAKANNPPRPGPRTHPLKGRVEAWSWTRRGERALSIVCPVQNISDPPFSSPRSREVRWSKSCSHHSLFPALGW